MPTPDSAGSSNSVIELLRAEGWGQYEAAFREHHIDEWVFSQLVEVDLKEIGVVSIGHRKRMLAIIAQRSPLMSPQASADGPRQTTLTSGTETAHVPPGDRGASSGLIAAQVSRPRSMKIFLSYGRDAYVPEIRALKDALEARGHQVWFDQEQLGVGLDWEGRIEQGLEWCDRVVLTMTPHSVRRPDGYCLNELAKALERQKIIIPLLLTDVPNGVPTSICRIQYLDWRDAVPAAQKPERFAVRMARLAEAIEQDKLDFEGGQQRLARVFQPLNYAADIERHVARFQGRKALFARMRLWLDDLQGPQVVWLCGGSGVGKSAIVAMLAHQWGETGAVHFCVAGHPDKADPRRAILSVAFQLSTHLDAYRTRLMALDLEREVEKDARSIFESLILSPLSGDFPVPPHPWIVVIDALDEATQADGQNELAELIGQEWRRLPSWLRLAVSSQPDGEVQTWLSNVTPIMITGEDPEQQADLRAYVQRDLAHMGREVTDAVIDRILERSEGTFQYAVLLLEEIRQGRCDPEDSVELPRGMQAAYLQTFKRRFPDIEFYRAQFRPLLDLILASPDPVPLALLARIVGSTPLGVRRLLAQLGSLVAIQPAEVPRDADWDSARLVQSSLRSWLTGIDERTRLPVAAAFAADIGLGSQCLAAEVLRLWDARSNRVASEPAGDFVARHVFTLQGQVGDTVAMDRIAMEVSQYWEKISLSRALAPARYASRWAEDLAAQPNSDPLLLARAASSFRQLGKVIERQGDTLGALAEYRRSQVLWERLTHAEPENLGWLRELGEVHASVATVLRAQGQMGDALVEQRIALSSAEDLVLRDPANPDHRAFLGKVLNQLGNMQRTQGDITSALETHHRALALRETLAAANPTDAQHQRDLAGSLNNIGNALKSSGDFRGALLSYQKFKSILEKLTESKPQESSLRRDLSISHFNLSNLLEDMGQLQEASLEAARCIDLRERLVREDPEHAGYLDSLSSAYRKRGSLGQTQGDLDAALADYSRALQISEKLVAQDPSNGVLQQHTAAAYGQIASVQQAKGQLHSALEGLQRGVAIRERLCKQDPLRLDWTAKLGDIASRTVDVLSDLGKRDEALEMASRVLELRQDLVRQSPDHAIWRQNLANSHHRVAEVKLACGLPSEALEHAHLALEIRQALAKTESKHADWQERLGVGYELYANILVEMGGLNEAESAYRQALHILRNLLERDPRHAGWLDLISDLHAEIGWVLECLGRLNEALEQYREDLRISHELILQGGGKAGWQRDLGLAHLNVGRVLLHQRQPEQAAEHSMQALRILAPMADPLTPGSLIDHAAALALAGHAQEACGRFLEALEIDGALATLDWEASAADQPERRNMLVHVVKRLMAKLDQLPESQRAGVTRRCGLYRDSQTQQDHTRPPDNVSINQHYMSG